MQVRTTREHNAKTREETNTEASLLNTPLAGPLSGCRVLCRPSVRIAGLGGPPPALDHLVGVVAPVHRSSLWGVSGAGMSSALFTNSTESIAPRVGRENCQSPPSSALAVHPTSQ